MSLQISSTARPKLALAKEPWFVPGKVSLPDFRSARMLALRVNDELAQSGKGEPKVTAGEVNALAVIEDVYQLLIDDFLEQRDPALLRRSREELTGAPGQSARRRTLDEFTREYLDAGLVDDEPAPDAQPPNGVRVLDLETAIRELAVLWVLHGNPAAVSITSVLHESPLLDRDDFRETVDRLVQLLAAETSAGTEDAEGLWNILLAPQRASPDSLLGQLQYLLRRWGDRFGDRLAFLRGGLDLFAEELAPRFPTGPGPAEAPSLSLADEAARYSVDRGWMPRLVLLAKNVYVWLDQLSREYGRPLRRLDEVPDAELQELARRGMTGLWLIGVWERSPASQRIKQMCGNPEAVASAYSLRRYQIAEDLGGETAFQQLKRRAWERGIRLAADMVPNHMGIDSDWVLDHPDWFLGDSQCPFPAYTFQGQDLSPRESVGIHLEDHYYDRSDAAVVFQRVDRTTGAVRHILHGNDGTSMPWNDTAQLDYLQPEVREAVIGTILEVARRFPVIRFDAAMTLAKRHYQRLWFPEPGTAGAIPSRAEKGLEREEFDRRMPEEFWRQVVDRVAAELPDTLLLAEAFWLMEGYFVRTLGMHRVYNSAFMNMLRDQENAKYRRLIQETLEFDPQILQRYVNFMSNPDELTAVEQFGKEDRYFGVAVVMATLPGLPMFAHGQFEGFAEKYGMEYRRAYWSEEPDRQLVDRHRREVVPLLERRELFAGVENFRLYDLVDDQGGVNEDVFAFSNGRDEERVLVLFNNRYQQARGRIRQSAPIKLGGVGDREPRLLQDSLAEALGLPARDGLFLAFRDRIGGLERLVSARELAESGLEVDLGAFHYRVLSDFRLLPETADRSYARLAERLAGAGVPSLEQARRSMLLEPLRHFWRVRLHPVLCESWALLEARQAEGEGASDWSESLGTEMVALADEAARVSGGRHDEVVSRRVRERLAVVSDWLWGQTRLRPPVTRRSDKKAAEPSLTPLEGHPELLAGALLWIALGAAGDELGSELTAVELLEEWSLRPAVAQSVAEMEVEPEESGRLLASLTCSLAAGWGRKATRPDSGDALVRELLGARRTREALHVHAFQGVEYLNRESLETLLRWRLLLESLAWVVETGLDSPQPAAGLAAWAETVLKIEKVAAASGYRSRELLAGLG